MTNFSNELQFAIDNGIKTETTVLENGDIMVTWNNGQCVEILTTEVENTEEDVTAEVVKESTTNQEIEAVTVESLDLTKKEKEVLSAIVENSYEYGLGMDSSALNTSIKGKSFSGVIGSLTKKGYVEGYLNGTSVGFDEFFNLTEEWYQKLTGEMY